MAADPAVTAAIAKSDGRHLAAVMRITLYSHALKKIDGALDGP
jgi:hypothetical protein